MNYDKCMKNINCKYCSDNKKCEMAMNKYRNKKTEYKGMVFDSKKEFLRYLVLEDKQNKGEIKNLKRQVPFILVPAFNLNKKRYREMKYIADYVYEENGKQVVEDVKGIRTDVYKLKKKLMAYIYQIEIKEV